MYEYFETRNYSILILEYCSQGNLHHYIMSSLDNDGKVAGLDEETARRIFCQLCNGVAYLHDQGVVHR